MNINKNKFEVHIYFIDCPKNSTNRNETHKRQKRQYTTVFHIFFHFYTLSWKIKNPTYNNFGPWVSKTLIFFFFLTSWILKPRQYFGPNNQILF